MGAGVAVEGRSGAAAAPAAQARCSWMRSRPSTSSEAPTVSPVRAEVQASAARPEPKWARESQRYASALVAASGEVVDEAVEVDDGGGGVALERGGLTDAEQCEPGVGAEGMGEGDAEPCVLRGDAVPLAGARRACRRARGRPRAHRLRASPARKRARCGRCRSGRRPRCATMVASAALSSLGAAAGVCARATSASARRRSSDAAARAAAEVVTRPRWRACATPCAAAARRERGVPRPPPS